MKAGILCYINRTLHFLCCRNKPQQIAVIQKMNVKGQGLRKINRLALNIGGPYKDTLLGTGHTLQRGRDYTTDRDVCVCGGGGGLLR